MQRVRLAAATLGTLLLLMMVPTVVSAAHSQSGPVMSSSVTMSSADGCPPGPRPTMY